MAGGKAERRHPLFPDFNDWFNREFPRLPRWRPAMASRSAPIKMTSGDGGYVLRAELSGMGPDDIGITVDGNRITVSAAHSESTADKEHPEFCYGSFRRIPRLPATISADDVEDQRPRRVSGP